VSSAGADDGGGGQPAGVGPRRILSLDGGGILAVFSIEILGRIEAQLREHYGRPDLVLADHFHLIAGTSSGAIIGALLSWGHPVARIRELYRTGAQKMFRKTPLWQFYLAKYRHDALTKVLKELFAEDDGSAALLGTKKLRTLLAVVMRNASTGSAWPVTNNPRAKYNQRLDEQGEPYPRCNLDLPLWQLVRASTAAPWYFPPEIIRLPPHEFTFLDGGITAYNNPALIAALTATLPAYRIEWPTGPERLQLVSIGTGATRTRLSRTLNFMVKRLTVAMSVPGGLIESITQQQDMLCRVLGECVFGDSLDREVGDLRPSGLLAPQEKKFRYVRYNKTFTAAEVDAASRQSGPFQLDNLRLMDLLRAAGEKYAQENVRLEHVM